MYWCIHDKTALAEAEVEYEMHTSPSVYVRYMLTSDPGGDRCCARGQEEVATIIWTTTPWTLPASMAVAFHPDAEYVGLEQDEYGVHRRRRAGAGDERENCDLQNAQEIARFPGRKLERVTFQHPFLDR